MSFLPTCSTVLSLDQDGHPNYLTKFIAIDTETTGLELHGDASVFAVSAQDHRGKQWYWQAKLVCPTHAPKGQRYLPKIIWAPETLEEIRTLIFSYPVWVFHNAKFDLRGLVKANILKTSDLSYTNTSPSIWHRIHDTSLMAHIADNAQLKSLKYLANYYLSIQLDDETQLEQVTITARRLVASQGFTVADSIEADYWMVPALLRSQQLKTYALRDAQRTALLFSMYQAALTTLHQEEIVLFSNEEKQTVPLAHLYHYEVERSLIEVVYNMETVGMELNTRNLSRCIREYGVDTQTYLRKLQELTGYHSFNPNSPKQVGEHLYKKLKYKIPKFTKGGSPGTDKESLVTLKEQHPKCQFLNTMLSYRAAETATEYVQSYEALAIKHTQGPVSSVRLHPSFRANGTVATRFSSQNPNGQNISTKADYPLRCCFGPSKGIWYDFDYSNLELRLFAYAAGERRLIEAFEQDISVHLVIAEELYGPRAKWKELNKDDWKKSPEYKRTKNGNFSLIYGAGSSRADATYGIVGASEIIRRKFTKLSAFMARCTSYIRKHGFIHTLFGRRLNLNDREKPYKAISLVIQGTAGEVLKWAMLELASQPKLVGSNVKLIANIHDELLFEAPTYDQDAVNVIRTKMEAPGKTISIPVPVEGSWVPTGGTWDKPEPLKA